MNHDVKPWFSDYHRKVTAGETKNGNSEIRYATLEKRLDNPGNNTTTEVIKASLRSKDNQQNPICRSYTEGGGIFTFSSVIFTLTGQPSVQVTFGSPDKAEYKQYFFKK